MKSYFLEHVSSAVAAEAALCTELPGQGRPWVVFHASGDAIAYVTVGTTIDGSPNIHVQAEISGRHYHEDLVVIALLEKLRNRAGGVICGSP